MKFIKNKKKEDKELVVWFGIMGFVFLILYVLSAFSFLLKNRLTNSFTQSIDILNGFFGVNEFHVIYLVLVFIVILIMWILKKE